MVGLDSGKSLCSVSRAASMEQCSTPMQKWCTRGGPAVRSIAWLGVGGSTNHVDHERWVRQHRDVATLDLTNRGVHSFRDKALQLRLDRAVLRGYDVPARFGLPGHAGRILVEEFRRWREMRTPDDLLLLLG